MATVQTCVFFGILLVNISADIIVEDWFSQKLKNDSALVINKRSATRYESPLGYIRHWSSKKFIHPRGPPWKCPYNGNPLVMYANIQTNGRTSFKFVQVEGHYGYIVQSCGKALHPEVGQIVKPPDGMPVNLHGDRHAGALFYVDEDKKLIVHRQGGLLSPIRDELLPGNDLRVCLRYGYRDGRRFEFVDEHFIPFSVYPKPSLNGHWEILIAVLDPIAKEHRYRVRYKVGRSVSRSATDTFAWKVSASVTLSWFSANTEFSLSVSHTKSETWNDETEHELNVTIASGETVVVWQYIFEANQFGDGLRFRSTILGNTKDVNTRPPII